LTRGSPFCWRISASNCQNIQCFICDAFFTRICVNENKPNVIYFDG
jgi:hypothetical protein